MKPRNQPRPFVAFLVVVLLLFLGAYMAAYYGMLERKAVASSVNGPVLQIKHFVPSYRNHHQVLVVTFYPANCVDRMFRPKYWSELRGWHELVPPS